MELRRYIAVIRRWLWLLVLGTAAAGAAAYILSHQQTPVYEGKGTILVNQAQTTTGPTYNDILANQQLSKTYSQLVTTRPVLEPLGRGFDLSYDQLRGMVSSNVRRETQLIDITVRSTDPQRAALIANATAAGFAEYIRQAQLGQRSAAEADLENQITAVQASIDEKQQLVTRLSAGDPGLPEDRRVQQVNEATAQLGSLRQNLLGLQRSREDLRVELTKRINTVALADPAGVPTTPVSPRVGLNTLLAAFLGLLVVSGIVAIVEQLDDTVKSPEDVTAAAGAATLGAIVRFTPAGRWRTRRQPAAPPRLLTSSESRSPIAEAYRMVRTNLEFARSGKAGHTMLVTSALPGEGKSTTTANLAVTMAQTGRRVIIVDADLRRPSLHHVFDVPNATGLSTLFVMTEPALGGLLRPTAVDGLRVLPSGPLPPNPAELLASERMGQIIELLTTEADMVLFDSPPLLGLADTSALAPRLDGVMLVVDTGRTRTGALTRAAETLARAQAQLWGVVLNKVKASSAEGYYYYHYRSYGVPADAFAAHTNGVHAVPSHAIDGDKGNVDAHLRPYAEERKH